MADVLRLVVFLEMIAHVAAERCAGNDATHQVHEHRQRRTFRPADRLHRAAIERHVWIGGLTAPGVERIAERDLLTAPRGAPDFPSRGYRRRHVEIERHFLAARRGHRNRAGAE